MVTLPGIENLQARKRDLLRESELNRQTLQLELEHVRYRVRQWQRSLGWLQTGWKWAAPLAGFFFTRKANKSGGTFAKGSMIFLLVRKLWEAWREKSRTET